MCTITSPVWTKRVVSIIIFDRLILVHHNLIFRCPQNFSRTEFIAGSQNKLFARSTYHGSLRCGGCRIVIDAWLHAILSVAFQYVVLRGMDCVWSTAVSDTVSKVGHPTSEERSQVWHGGNDILLSHGDHVSIYRGTKWWNKLVLPYADIELNRSPKHKQCWIPVPIRNHSDLSQS